MVPVDSVSDEVHFLDFGLFSATSHGGGGRELCGVPHKKALILFTRAPPSWPDHLPKAWPLSAITLQIRISTYESGGTYTLRSQQRGEKRGKKREGRRENVGRKGGKDGGREQGKQSLESHLCAEISELIQCKLGALGSTGRNSQNLFLEYLSQRNGA